MPPLGEERIRTTDWPCCNPDSEGRLEGDLLHHSYHSLEDHERQIDYFSDIAAASYTGGVMGILALDSRCEGVFSMGENKAY